MRKLASIQKIVDIQPIIGADNIEVVQILGWKCVAKKGEFQIGDLCVYFEIDSILPEGDKRFDFMESTRFRVRTRKFRKQISQGLAMPLNLFPEIKKPKLDDDATKLLKVIKYEDPDEKIILDQKSDKSFIKKLVLSNPFLTRLFGRFFVKTSKKFPSFIPKTDETRIQVIFETVKPLFDNTVWYITKKMDGSSGTFYYNQGVTGIASRNVSIYKGKKYQFVEKFFDGRNIYLDVNTKYNITEKLAKFCRDNKRNLAIQGEICGPNIQGNRIGLTQITFYVFNIYDIDKKQYVNFLELEHIVEELDLTLVPVLEESVVFGRDTTLEYFLDYVKTVKYNTGYAEGIVIRPVEESLVENNRLSRVSFKVINPEYLLKYNL